MEDHQQSPNPDQGRSLGEVIQPAVVRGIPVNGLDTILQSLAIKYRYRQQRVRSESSDEDSSACCHGRHASMRQWMSSNVCVQRAVESVLSSTSRTLQVRGFERVAVAVHLQAELVNVSLASIAFARAYQVS
jgi:hypothetical protein